MAFGQAPPSTGLGLLEDTLKKQKPIQEDPDKLACEAKGGRWDAAAKNCIMPLKEEQEEAPVKDEGFVVRKDQFGEIAGFEKGDNTYYRPPGLSDEEWFGNIEKLSGQQARRTTVPVGATIAGTAQEMNRKLRLAQGVGQIDFETANQLDEMGINVREAVLAGTADIIPGALAVGGTAAAAGLIGGPAAPVSVPVAAAVGGVIGAVGAFYRGVNQNIKAQKGDLISGKRTELKQRQRSMMNYISAANANPASADEMLQAYITEKSLARKDYNSLVKEANEDLSYWGGQDGTPQLIAYEIYFESIEPSLDLRMEQAILKPDPTRAYLDVGDIENEI